jgi:hypothetical protein
MMVYKPNEFPVSVNEVAEILDVEPATVSTWKSRKLMPKPDALLNKGTTRVWRIDTILEWANATGRNPKRLSVDKAYIRAVGGQIEGWNEEVVRELDDNWDSIGSFNE